MKVFLPEEGHGALGRHSFGEQSLSCSWWSVQQDSGPVQTQRQELWTLQRKLDRVQDLLLHLLQPSDIVPAHIRDLFTCRCVKSLTADVLMEFCWSHSESN